MGGHRSVGTRISCSFRTRQNISDSLGDPVPAVLARPTQAPASQFIPHVGTPEDKFKTPSNITGVQWIYKHGRVSGHLRKRRASRRDYRSSAGHRFHQRQSEALQNTGEYERVRSTEQCGHLGIRECARIGDTFADSSACNPPSNFVVTVATEHKFKTRIPNTSERIEQPV